MSSIIEDYQGILGITGGIIALCVAVATYFRGVIQQNQKINAIEQETNKRIHTLELDLRAVQTRFDVFWAVIEKELPKILIRTDTPDIDNLLRKMEEGTITTEEKQQLKEMMREELTKYNEDDGRNEAIRFGYVFIIAGLESELAAQEKTHKGRSFFR